MGEIRDKSLRERLQDTLRRHRVRSRDLGPRETGAEAERALLSYHGSCLRGNASQDSFLHGQGPRAWPCSPPASCLLLYTHPVCSLWDPTLACFPTHLWSLILRFFSYSLISRTSKWWNNSGLNFLFLLSLNSCLRQSHPVSWIERMCAQ